MRILFICTGNTCRSPMAEIITRSKLLRRNVCAEVMSAGLAATDGQPVSENSLYAMKELGYSADNHSAKQLTAEMLDNVDLAITMTADQKAALGARHNVYTLSDLTDCGDIPDPYGGDKELYLRTARTLESACETLVNTLI